ncbi:CoA transferase subunit A [Pseudonocardia asaccharolytica]|uniref:Putative succinyl-CoA:3-ketoacid coenzyme A transferase subunit A n=1 Tax=Pseudonocardia asaccharolytica DSM 44247 = NBRC 16224 TaxID=1123024 RepID=A0A511D3H7_9PSEU|nr:CoA transferase subunit A [Pseudonocardia asaccharolytica]GEL19227.1 putative succinyl-CoA:3-ketoacid coenzyme A transferase subunit A [Pseudonocardia asaccharolytica DSM 44247 = NBRC 16224]
MDKVYPSAREAVADIGSGASIAAGGFGVCGIPAVLIDAIADGEARDLELISNNCGADGRGLGRLLENRQVRRVVASYVGENKTFASQYLAGELEVELTPQGTLAERLRAAGVGVAAFYTRTGTGTLVAEGGLPWRYGPDGGVAMASPPKPVAIFDGVEHVLERALPADFALVRAWKGDRHGNLTFRMAARNFNPVCAMAGRVVIAEVEHLVEPGEIDPDEVHLPGVYVDRVVALTAAQAADKAIERLTVRDEER